MSSPRYSISFQQSDRVPNNKFTFYKAEKDRTDIIALVSFVLLDDNVLQAALAKNPKYTDEQLEAIRAKWLGEQEKKKGRPLTMQERCNGFTTPKFDLYQQYYNEDLKLMAVRDPGCMGPEDDWVWAKVSEGRTQLVTVMLQYPVVKNDDGDYEVDVDRAQKGYKVLPWKFGPGIFEKLKKQQAAASKNKTCLGLQDISVTCKDTTYQNIEVSLNGPAVWLTFPEELKEKILRDALKVANSESIVPGKSYTTSQLKEKLGIKDGKTPSVVIPGEEDEGDVSGSGSGQGDGGGIDPDDLLGGLLDKQDQTSRVGVIHALFGYRPVSYGIWLGHS